MRRIVIGILLACASSAAGQGEACRSKPEIRQKVFVPSAARRHGEVRLAVIPPCGAECTSAVVCVETVLFTRELPRGIRRIRDEEEDLWPEGSAHRADSQRFLAALDVAMKSMRAGSATAKPEDPVPVELGRRDLLLRFERGPSSGRIQIGRVELEGTEGGGPVQITSCHPLSTVSVTTDYVEKSMPRMLARAFDVEDSQTGRWVDQALADAGLAKPGNAGSTPANPTVPPPSHAEPSP